MLFQGNISDRRLDDEGEYLITIQIFKRYLIFIFNVIFELNI